MPRSIALLIGMTVLTSAAVAADVNIGLTHIEWDMRDYKPDPGKPWMTVPFNPGGYVAPPTVNVTSQATPPNTSPMPAILIDVTADYFIVQIQNGAGAKIDWTAIGTRKG